MSDLISRKALCDDLREYKVYPGPVSSDESEVKGYNDGIDLAISVITNFPSAEPERKKGEWVDCDTEDINDYPIETWQTCRCTSCGKWHTTPYKYNYDQYPFCPNCGAEKRGENDRNSSDHICRS